MNEVFWKLVKGLEGRTVKEVREYVEYEYEEGHGEVLFVTGITVECEDGYTVNLAVDYEDVELTATQSSKLVPAEE